MNLRILAAVILGAINLLIVVSRWVMMTIGSPVGFFQPRPMMILLGLSGLLLIFTPRASAPEKPAVTPPSSPSPGK